MDPESIAHDIAAYLKGRDDVADAEVTEVDELGAQGTIRTQGGVLFAFTVVHA